MPKDYSDVSRWPLWSVFCLVFGVLPLLLIGWGLEQSWERQFKIEADRLAEKVVRRLEHIRKEGLSEEFYYDWLRITGTRIDQALAHRDFPARIHGITRRLERSHPGLFDLYLTDHEGNLLESLSARVPSRFVIKRLFEVMTRRRTTAVYDLPRGQKKALEVFLGEASTVEDLNDARELQALHTVGVGVRHNFFFFRKFSRFALMAHVNTGAVPPHFPLKTLVDRANRSPGSVTYGLHLAGESGGTLGVNPAEEAFLRKCLREYETTTRDVFVSDQVLTAILMGDGKERLWALLPFPVERDPRRFRDLLRGALLALLLIFGAVSHRFLVRVPAPWLSIRQKLVILLGFVGGLPLVILWVVGQDYLWEKERSLREETFAELETTLRGIDNKFPLALRNMAAAINQLVKKGQDAGGEFRRDQFDHHFKALDERIPVPTPMILRRDGTILQNRQQEKILQHLGQNMMEKYNLSRGITVPSPSQERARLDTLFSTDKAITDILTYMLKRLGSVERLNFFGKMNRYLLINAIHGGDGGANYMFFFFWPPNNLMGFYVASWAQTQERITRQRRFFAINPHDPGRSHPSLWRREPWLRDFTRRVAIRRKVTKEQIRIRGQDFLVTGVTGKELENYVLIQILPESRVREAIAGLRRNLAVLGLFCLFFSLMVGATIARQVLIPVGKLTQGVSAIESGHFAFRVPPWENDELGKLTQTFNHMMEGLGELSVARTVQESLFPPRELKTDRWYVYGQTQTATELGGDYLDYFVLKDGRVLVLVGDVTGHGVPAALIMAMAKATVANQVGHDPSPGRVLKSLGELIFDTMHRRRFLTFFYLLTSADSGEVTFANAGHCQPVLVRTTGEVEEIGAAGFPLGIKRDKEYPEEVRVLQPGDRLYFFTDGFPESTNADREQFGYGPIAELFPKVNQLTPREACDQVFDTISRYHGGLPQEDDNTLIVLEYRGP